MNLSHFVTHYTSLVYFNCQLLGQLISMGIWCFFGKCRWQHWTLLHLWPNEVAFVREYCGLML